MVILTELSTWLVFGLWHANHIPPTRNVVLEKLRVLPFAPSVQMQRIPRQSVAEIIAPTAPDWSGDGEEDKNSEDLNEIDDRIQSMGFLLSSNFQ